MSKSICQDIYSILCQKHPNKKIYIIGDQHFYHNNIIEYTRENFHDVTEMNEYIINIHNQTVSKDDIIIFLGDFCFKKHFIKSILSQLNGHKYLILGNHDPKDIIKSYPTLGFEGVFITPVKIKESYLSHEPLQNNEKNELQTQLILNEFVHSPNAINYHGHIHEKENIASNYQNVTCEALDYKPKLIGYTTVNEKQELPNFINSPYFNTVLSEIKAKHNIEPSILISDYIYSSILENYNILQSQYFVQGSFGLLKKFHFLSHLSDLDISFLYNPNISKTQNITLFKTMADSSYESLKEIEGINLRFEKRYPSLHIFEALYTSQQPYFSKNYYDSNLIYLDCYKHTDFFHLNGTSIIERFLSKTSPSLLDEFKLPQFTAQFLTPEGDIANLLLQLIFQQGYEEKKPLLQRKLQYVYNQTFKKKEMKNFSNIFCRFFLRNIALLYTLRRYKEIEYVQNNFNNLFSILSSLPFDLSEQFYSIICNNNKFADIHNEIATANMPDVFQKCEDIARKLVS